LALERHGLRYLDVEPAQVNMSWDGGPAWPLFHDVDRTLEALRLTYPTQVDGYRRYVSQARPVAELILELANHPPRPGGALRQSPSNRPRGAPAFLRWSRMPGAAVLGLFFTHDAVLAPAIVVGPAVWGLAPSTPGTGLGAITYAM